MTLVLPSVPDIPAGSIVTADQLNDIGSACTFLLNKPMALVFDSAGGQSVGTTYPPTANVSFASKYYDTDGIWSSGAPTKLTIQTPGFYKVWYTIVCASGTPLAVGAGLWETTGASNPAGSGVSIGPFWGTYVEPQSTTGARASCMGLWPVYLYAGDSLSLRAYAATNTTTTSNTNPSCLGVEWVST